MPTINEIDANAVATDLMSALREISDCIHSPRSGEGGVTDALWAISDELISLNRTLALIAEKLPVLVAK